MTKHGFYSAKMDKKFGSFELLIHETGERVRVTAISDSGLGGGGLEGWGDAVYVGRGTPCYDRDTRPQVDRTWGQIRQHFALLLGETDPTT